MQKYNLAIKELLETSKKYLKAMEEVIDTTKSIL
jgi:uncharacterized protein YaaN involved in tellurite resistance